MYNICRAFTLYNDFALPGNTEINPGEYLSFGYYDGISVSGNLFQDVDGKYTVFCKTFLHKIAKTFCRSLQLHFVGNCKPSWQSWYLPAI